MSSRACDHLPWVHLFHDLKSGYSIRYDDRYHRLTSQMNEPIRQNPSLALFLGNKSKEVALRQIFPTNNLRRSGVARSTVNLRLDNSSVFKNYPTLFADCDPTAQLWTSDVPCRSLCHEQRSFPLQWATDHHRVLDILLARLFFPVTDLVCIFAKDFGGLEKVRDFITTWVSVGCASSLPTLVRPRVVVVSEDDGSSATHTLLDMEDFRHHLLEREGLDLLQSFTAIKVIQLPDKHLSPLARHRRLREIVTQELDHARTSRRASNCLFSAVHQEAFFKAALSHVAATIREPFNFVRASRAGNELSFDFTNHLQNFLFLGVKYRVSYDSLSSYIASTILINAYPPGMHLFHPMAVFDELYRSHCAHTFRVVYGSTKLAEALCHSVQENLVQLWTPLCQGLISSSESHRANLGRRKEQWQLFKTNLTCLACLQRRPEHHLGCGHSICDTCVEIFGDGMVGFRDQYVMKSCIVCHVEGGITVRVKPRCAAARMLCIDGGGSRGVVPLKTLSLLQDLAGNDCPIRDLFDIAVGTSAGGLIVLSVFIQQWPIGKCVDVFTLLSKRLFGRDQLPNRTVKENVRRMLSGWLSDGFCDYKGLEEALVDQFGPNMRMFDYRPRMTSGTKVAVTAANINEASAFVFSNYNGEGTRKKDCGYRLVRPTKIENEVLVWQAGRATSAAPVLFPPAQIPHVGTFQDGAMGGKHNNPIHLALWEKRCIWPSDPEPAVVLSLGTGTAHEVHSPQAKPAHSFRNGFLSRIYRSGVASFESQNTWRELWNSLDEQNRQDYFRLNVGFPGPEPAINDAGCMEELSSCVQTRPEGRSERFESMSALLISNLYFELDEIAAYRSGFYHCKGSIRCRLNAHIIIRAILRLHSDDVEICSNDTPTGFKVTERDICPACYIYRRPVEFLRRSTSESPMLSLRWKEGCERKLGAMRESISWFEQQQGLRDFFGSSNHGRPYALKCPVCSPDSSMKQIWQQDARARKHANHSPTHSPPKKRLVVRP